MDRDELLRLMAGMEQVVSGAVLMTVRQILAILRTRRLDRDTFTFASDKSVDDAVNELLMQLSDAIILETEKRTKMTVEDEDNPAVIAWIRRPIEGKTLTERMDQHTSNLKRVIETFIATMLSEDASVNGLLPRFLPWLDTHSFQFGRGMASNPINGMYHLSADTINDGMIHGSLLSYERDGAVGYMVYRGTNFPCELCDDVCFGANGRRRLYSFEEECPVPVHPNCRCYTVAVYAEDLIG